MLYIYIYMVVYGCVWLCMVREGTQVPQNEGQPRQGHDHLHSSLLFLDSSSSLVVLTRRPDST